MTLPRTTYIALRFRWSIVALLVLTLHVQLLASVATSKSRQLRKRLGSVQQQIGQVRHQIRVKEQEKRTVIGQLNLTEQKLEVAQRNLSENKLKLMDADSDLAATVRRLERTKKQLKRRQGLLARRIVDIYEGEDLDYVNVVLGASDMWTFLTQAHYLKKILDADAELISQIKADKAAIERDKARQARRVEQIQGLQVRLEIERNQISELAERRRDQLIRIEHSKELYEKALDELLAKSAEIEAEIRRIQCTPAGRVRYARTFRGALIRPCVGWLTSPFGYRRHPITGVYKLHTGVDFAACAGTPIRAAADGVVIISGWNGAYGYAVVIDHGGGVSTLYGHCSSLLVSVGQHVRQGEIIARVGSTGLSTGPHCHFEKRIDGRPVNPL
jgi:murein DD-endopeptidase MepM/ murein hydrolase activator NlpD